MSRLATLEEVREQVETLSKNNWDDLIPVNEITFDSLDRMLIGADEHNIKPHAQRLICNRLGIPYQYLHRCEPELQAENLNQWMAQEKNQELFVRFQNNDVRALFTPRYKPIDNLDVLDQLHQIGFNDDAEVQYSLDDQFFMLNLLEKDKSFHIQKGDRMTPGISIGNSEIGLSSLSLAAYVLRLVCTNGLISTTQIENSYRHISERILNEFPEVIGRLGQDLGKSKDQWRISLETEVKDPDATIRSFNRQFQLNEKEVEAAFWGYGQDSGQTMFHVVNGYTKGAHFNGLSSENEYKLQRTGGSILAMLN